MPQHTPPKKKRTGHPQKTTHHASSAPGDPVFAQPTPSPDPTSFKDPVTDQSDKEIASVEPVPEPVGNAVEPILTLAQVYGSQGATKTQTITTAGQIVFHSVGDTGSVIGPIAKVFDACSTPEGRPYFAMEYVDLLSASLFAKYRCWISIRGSTRRKIARNCAHH